MFLNYKDEFLAKKINELINKLNKLDHTMPGEKETRCPCCGYPHCGHDHV